MTQFQPGDIVECVDDGGTSLLVRGGRYTVRGLFSNQVAVNADPQYWLPSRFRLVSRPGDPQPFTPSDTQPIGPEHVGWTAELRNGSKHQISEFRKEMIYPVRLWGESWTRTGIWNTKATGACELDIIRLYPPNWQETSDMPDKPESPLTEARRYGYVKTVIDRGGPYYAEIRDKVAELRHRHDAVFNILSPEELDDLAAVAAAAAELLRERKGKGDA